VIGYVNFISENAGKDAVTLLSIYMLYDKKLLDGKGYSAGPMIAVLSSKALRFEDIPGNVLEGVKIAERIMNMRGDIWLISVNPNRLESQDYIEHLASRIEKLLFYDSLKWGMIKEKYTRGKG